MSIVYHSPAGDMWLCYTCGKYYFSMMGDKCDKCCVEERKQKEEDIKHAQLIKELQEISRQLEANTLKAV